MLTKLDGDSRGGAALSVRASPARRSSFAGTSEKIDGLEVFDAERHAGRILGMGDIVALVEQVAAGVDMTAAQAGRKGQKRWRFDLNDFLAQIQQMKQMGGPLQPDGQAARRWRPRPVEADLDKAEKDIRRKEGIITA